MDRGAWRAADCGVAESQTRLSAFQHMNVTLTFTEHLLWARPWETLDSLHSPIISETQLSLLVCRCRDGGSERFHDSLKSTQ